MTVPSGLRPPPPERGNFETIEVQVPVAPVAPAPPVEVVKTREDRADMAIVGPIAALVLALTISSLVLQNPTARTVAAGLATLGLIVAVALMLMGKRPQRGRHVALPEADAEVPVPVAPVRVAGTGWTAPDRDGATVRIASGWSTADPRTADPRTAGPRVPAPPAANPRAANPRPAAPRPAEPRPAEPRTSRHRRE